MAKVKKKKKWLSIVVGLMSVLLCFAVFSNLRSTEENPKQKIEVTDVTFPTESIVF